MDALGACAVMLIEHVDVVAFSTVRVQVPWFGVAPPDVKKVTTPSGLVAPDVALSTTVAVQVIELLTATDKGVQESVDVVACRAPIGVPVTLNEVKPDDDRWRSPAVPPWKLMAMTFKGAFAGPELNVIEQRDVPVGEPATNVHVDDCAEAPEAIVTLTLPVGETSVPGSMSVTVNWHDVVEPVAMTFGVHAPVIWVLRFVTENDPMT